MSSFARGVPLEHDFGEGVEGAMGGRGVGGENRGVAIGVGEVVVENVVGARFCFGVFNGCCYLEVFGGEWWRVIGGIVIVMRVCFFKTKIQIQKRPSSWWL